MKDILLSIYLSEIKRRLSILILTFCSFIALEINSSPIILSTDYFIDISVDDSHLIADLLMEQNLSADVFHLFTHGKSGHLFIEGKWLNQEQILAWILDNDISLYNNHLNIYGCNFAQGEKGKAAVEYLEKNLNISISASDDVTGIDGDWDLEIGDQISRLKIFNYQENLQLDNSNWNPDGSECIENILLYPGVAAITCSVVQDQPANERYVVAFFSMNGTHSVTGRTNITDTDSVLHHTDWLVENIGNVFGTEINQNTGEVFVTASSNYASSIGVNNISGTILNYGTIGNPASDTEAAGRVYRIDPVTGAVTVFATLPQQTSTFQHWDCERNQQETERTTGVGLGNIAYDEINDQYFVTNAEDGRIYRLNNAGVILDSYDPFNLDSGVAGIDDLNEIPYGIAVEPGSGRVFFGMVDASSNGNGTALAGSPGIYSIDLDTAGGFVGTATPSGNGYDNFQGTEFLHSIIPTGSGFSYTNWTSYFISDLEFTADGNLLAGVRVGCYGSWHSSYNHFGETDVLTPDASGIYGSPFQYDISVTGDAGPDDNYGGVAGYDARNEDCDIWYLSTSADIIEEIGPHGITAWDNTNMNSPVSPIGVFSYGVLENSDPKGIGGDVDIFNGCPLVCDISGPTQACSGDSLTFSYVPECPHFTHLWEVSGMATISGVNNANSVMVIAGSGDFTLSLVSDFVESLCGIEVSVGNVDCNAGVNTNLCMDQEMMLSGSTTSTNATFSWSTTDGNILSGTTTATPTIDAGGTYVLTVTDGNGCTDSCEVVISSVNCCESIAGVVFEDFNNDGCQSDTGDGVAGVTVEILQCNADGTTTVLGTTVTVADGSYAFGPDDGPDNICLDPMMTYQTSISNSPSGYMNSTGAGMACAGDEDDSPLNNGESECYNPSDDDGTDTNTDQHIDFGIYPCQDIGGIVFYDLDNDGCQEAGEDPVTEDVTVNLYACDSSGTPGSTPVASTTTINGAYEFGPDSPNAGGDICLDPAVTYLVEFVVPNAPTEDLHDWNLSTNADAACQGTDTADDVDPLTGQSDCYNPAGDDDDMDIDAGIYPCQDLGGIVFYDLNNDGCQGAGETPVSEDVTVNLYACDATGAPGAAPVASTTTINGEYEFGPDSPNVGGEICLDPAVTYLVEFDIPNATGEDLEDFNLSSNADPSCQGTDTADDVDPSNGQSDCFNPAGDDDDQDIDAGIYPCQDLGGIVFYDLNNDGCQGAGEDPVLEDVTVNLFACDATGAPGINPVASTTTINGEYEFGPDSPNVGGEICLDPAVTYLVEFDIPNAGGEDLENWNLSSNADPSCQGTDTADDVDPATGQSDCYDPNGDDDDLDIDAGIYPCQDLGGIVFYDLNNDGCQGMGDDLVLEDVTVNLYACDAAGNPGAAAVASTTTINGEYEFGPDSPNVGGEICLDPAVTYLVEFDIPNAAGEDLENFNFSSNADPSCQGTDTADDVDPATGQSTCYDPSGDDDDQDIDAGIVPCQDLGGIVFYDLNNNGCQEMGEDPVTEDVVVNLFACDATGNPGAAPVASTTTIAGAYEFGPGSPNAGADICLDPSVTYLVEFDIPNAGGEDLEDWKFSSSADAFCQMTDTADDVNPTTGQSDCYDPSGDDDDQDIDAGIYPCEDLGGIVFYDLDNDGCQEAGEDPVTEDVIVNLYACDATGAPGAAPVASTTTINGAYEFGPNSPNVGGEICLDPAVTYLVEFDIPNAPTEDLEDWNLSTNADAACQGTDAADDVDPATGQSTCYNPAGDDDDQDIDAGIYPCEELGGIVFYDLDNDGCQEAGETAVAEDVTVNLYACDATGVPGAAPVASTTTINGAYEFGPDSPNLGAQICLDPAVTYLVEFDIPNATGEDLEDWNLSTNADAACQGTDTADDVDPSNGQSDCYNPAGDDDDQDIDAGIYPCQDLGGIVFYDLNNDGCQGTGETPVSEDVTVNLYACDATGNPGAAPVASTTTIAGEYEFGPDSPNVGGEICLDPAVTYLVEFDIPNATGEDLEDWNLSTNADPSCQGTDTADDVNPLTGQSDCYDPSEDDDDLDIDAGIYPCQDLGGIVFYDLNNDGCQGAGDNPVLEDVTVNLYACDATGAPGINPVASTTTINGEYEFGPDSPNVGGEICLDPAVTYLVEFDIPNAGGEDLENWNLSSNADPSCQGTDTADDVDPTTGQSDCFDPNGDDDDQDIDAGIYPCQDLGGIVFYDLNNDGCQGMGEDPVVEDVTVNLYACDAIGNPGAAPVASTTTINGEYVFGPESPNIGGDICLDPAVTYLVEFDIPNAAGEDLENHNFSSNADPSCQGTDTADDVDPATGQSTCYDPSGDDDDQDIDAGIVPCQDLGGIVFYDLDNDGCQEVGETAVSEDVTVNLYACDASGNPGAAPVASTTTINGAYEFGPESPNAGADICLDPSITYLVEFDIPNAGGEDLEDWNLSSNADPSCQGTDTADDVDPATGQSDCYDPSGDDDDQDIDAGIYPCETLGGIVFYDLNNDGCQGAGENPVTEDVTVNLYACDATGAPGEAPVASTTTIAGEYEFGPDSPNVGGEICLDPAVTYLVEFDIPNAAGEDLEDWNLSSNADSSCQGTETADDVDPSNGQSTCYNPSGDDDDMDIDAGIWPCEEVAGEIFYDINNNGCQEAGEALVTEDIVVTLFECAVGTNSGGTQIARTTVTDGDYEFGPNDSTTDVDLCLDPARDYYVVFGLPNGTGEDLEHWTFTTNPSDPICATNGEADDVDPNTGTSSCYNPSDINPSDTDTDQHIDAGIVYFDLALNKVITTPAPYYYGNDITFTIEVCNQGYVTATDIEVTDYIPNGYVYNAGSNMPTGTVNSTSWSGSAPTVTTTISGPLAPGACQSVDIVLILTESSTMDWVNYAEISYAEDTNGNGTDGSGPNGGITDVDSTPDGSNSNDPGGEPNSDADNYMDGNGTGVVGDGVAGTDEDDHDPALPEVYDLALAKDLKTQGPFKYGDILEYVITVENEGNVVANSHMITDHLPCGLIYNTAFGNNAGEGWEIDAIGNPSYTSSVPLAPGESYTKSVYLQLVACRETDGYVNIAEITTDDGDDADSFPGTFTLQEDDEDPAVVEVFDLALTKIVDDIGPYIPGEIAEFTITVYNQGNVNAYDIEVTDYLNAGYIFQPSWGSGESNLGWTLNGSQITYDLPGPLAPGTSTEILIYLEVQVAADATLSDWYNEAEISFATDTDDSGINTVDADSTPDSDPNNDNDVQDGPDADIILDGDDNDNEIFEDINDPFGLGDDDEDDNDAAEILVVGKICGTIWEDCNGDGVRNDIASGLSGVQVDVFSESGIYQGSVVTNNSGYYELENLIPGNYYVKVNKPTDYVATEFRQGVILENDSDIDDSNGDCTTPSSYVRPGECDPGAWDAGLYTCTPVGELVWYDINENDIKDSFENGINGLEVELWELTSGVWNLVETQYTGHKPGTPSDDGYFKFCALPGTYEVRVNLPAQGLVPTRKDVGINAGLILTDLTESTIDSDLNFNQQTDVFVIDCNTGDVCNIGAGYYPMSQVGNRVWLDANGDGLQGNTESGIGGVTVEAYDADDNMINSDITDNSGNYKIDYLGQDDYYLRFTPPSNTGYGPTIPNQGNDDSVDSDIDGSNGPNTTSLISLNSGDDLPTVDAGLTFGVVPVEWLSFTGVSRENFNKLDWSTASERNVSHFEIERSLHNTVGFVSIGKIVAVGNSSEVSNYKMRDYDVEKKGAYYYRLKQVDYNGYHEYSNTIRIERKGVRNNGIDLYPNPTIEEFTIDLNVAKQSKVHISIWDAAGKLVGNNEINKVIEEGNYRRTIDVSTLPAGIYNVKVTIENTVYNKKLLIVH